LLSAGGRPCGWPAAADLNITTQCQKLRLERAAQSPSLPRGSERFIPFCRPGPRPGCVSSHSRGHSLQRRRDVNRDHPPSTARTAFGVASDPSLPSPASGKGGGRLPNALTFQRLPPLKQSQPKRPVFGIARSSRKASAFVGAPPELVVRAGPNDHEGEGLIEHRRGLLFGAFRTKREQKSMGRLADRECSS